MKSIKRKFKKQLSLFLAVCMCVMTMQGMPLIAVTEDITNDTNPAPSSVTVSFDANGGEGGTLPEPIVQTTGAAITIPAPSEEYCGVKEGYTLDTTKWGLETDGDIYVYAENEYMPEEDTVLYAVWEVDELEKQEELEEFNGLMPTTLVIDVSTEKSPIIYIQNRSNKNLLIEWDDGSTEFILATAPPGVLPNFDQDIVAKKSEYPADKTTASIRISIYDIKPSEAIKGYYRFGSYADMQSIDKIKPVSNDLISIEAGDYSAVGNRSFLNCQKLEKANLEKCIIYNDAPTSSSSFKYNNTDMSFMFNGCTKLTDVTIPEYTRGGATMKQMFYNCASLKILDLSKVNTEANSSVKTTMFAMLGNCNKLEQLTLGASFKLQSDAGLRTPTDLDGSDGKWYDIEGKAYEPSKVHEGVTVEKTYFAVNPNYTPEIKINSYSSDIVEIVGNTLPPITVDATVSGNRKISYKWYKSETQDKDNSILIQESESPEYILANKLPKGEYYYYCELSAPDCSDVSTEMIKVSIRDGSVLKIDLEKLNDGEDNTPTLHIQNNTDKEIYIDWGDGTTSSYPTTQTSLLKPSAYSAKKEYEIKIISEEGATKPYIFGNGATDVKDLMPIITFSSQKNALTEVITGVGSTFGKGSFYNCNNLSKIDLKASDISAITDMSYMFAGCSSLTELDVKEFDTKQVTNMASMFEACSSLTELDVKEFDTKQVTDMSNMFKGCENLVTLNLSKFITEFATHKANMSNMFDGCISLGEVILGGSFKFNNENSYLPVPDNSKFPETNGNWYNKATGDEFAPKDVHRGITKETTYVVQKPRIIRIYFNTRNSTTLSSVIINDTMEELPVIKWGDNTAKNNYTFAGWYTGIDGEGTLITADEAKKLDTNLSVYAKWTVSKNSVQKTVRTEKLDLSDVTNNQDNAAQGWSWNNAEGTLLLNNATFNVLEGDAIKLGKDLDNSSVIQVDGNVNITTQGNTDSGILSVGKSLMIQGLPSSKLTINSVGNGIRGKDLIVRNLDVRVDSKDSEAVFVNDNIYILDSIVETLGNQSAYNKVPLTPEGAIVKVGNSASEATEGVYTNQKYASISLGTSDGTYATKLTLDLTTKTSLKPTIFIQNNTNQNIIIDWGDGEASTISSGLNQVEKSSPYKQDIYTVTISKTANATGSYVLGGVDVGGSKVGVLSLDATTSKDNGLKNIVAGKGATIGASSFNGCNELVSVDITACDISGMTDMSYMFDSCSSLTNILWNKFDTTQVTSMQNMFAGCSQLVSIDVSWFNTSSVTDMSNMFKGCENLVTLNLSKFITVSATLEAIMSNMFDDCISLAEITLGKDFKFNNEDSYLPVPDSSKFPETNGKWYNKVTGDEFAPKDVHKEITKETTYVVLEPTIKRVSFDTRNSDTLASVIINEEMEELPTIKWGDNTAKDNYTFEGWYTDIDGKGTLITADKAKELGIDLIVYAKWTVSKNSVQRTVRTEKLDLSDLNNNQDNAAQGWSWNNGEGTLLLNNATFNVLEGDAIKLGNASSDISIVQVDGNVNITTQGSSDTNTDNAILSVGKSLLIQGLPSNKLTINSVGNGIQGDNLVFRNLDMRVDSKDSEAIFANDNIYILDSIVETLGNQSAYNKVPLTPEGASVKVGDSALTATDGVYTNQKYAHISSKSSDGNYATKLEIDLRNKTSLKPTIFIQNNTNQNIIIDWGDGDVSTISDGEESITKPSPYKKGIYTVTIAKTANASGSYVLGGVDVKGAKVMNSKVGILSLGAPTSKDNGLTSIVAGKGSSIGASSFNGCNELVSVDITACDTSEVTDMSYMFNSCSSLNDIVWDKIDTKKVISMKNMFAGCSKLKGIDVISFNTLEVSNMESMFEGCSTIEILDLSAFDTTNTTKMDNMFKGCSDLKIVKLGAEFKFNTELSYLPVPSTDGVWYDVDTTIAYLPKEVHKNATTTKTYMATKPKGKITIEKQPSNMQVGVGASNKSLSVDAVASYGLKVSYQWYSSIDGTIDNAKPIIGGTSSEYNLPDSLEKGEYYYYCKLSANGCDDVTTKVVKVTIINDAGTVEGEVTQDDKPVEGAKITVWRGVNQIGNEYTTDKDGKYSVTLGFGAYNLKATNGDKIVTVPVVINNSVVKKDISIPNTNGNQNTIVDVIGTDTPPVASDLNYLFKEDNNTTNPVITTEDREVISNGGTVEIQLIAEKKDEDAVIGDAEKIKEFADLSDTDSTNAKYFFIDLNVLKNVTPLNSALSSTPLSNLGVLIDIRIEVPEEYRSENLRIFRVHDDKAEELTLERNKHGEYIELNDDNSILTLKVKRFSTFAFMNVERDGSGDGDLEGGNPGNGSGNPGNGSGDSNNTSTEPPYYQIEIPEIEGGTIHVPNNGKVQEGGSITITIIPDGNFEIADVIIDGVSVGPVTDYTFTNVRGNHTIEVIFKEKDDTEVQKTDELSGENDNLLNTLNHNAYMKGYKNNEFRPKNNMTRAEVVVMFSRLMKSPMDSSKVYTSSFIDVDSSKWYANELGYMERFSIVNGYSDGTFRGDMPVTRAEFTTIASRFMPLEEGELIFTDVDSSYWASAAIASATAKGWIKGYEDNTFRPGQTITRAEAVTIVNRMLGRNCAADIILEQLEGTSNVYTDVTPSNWAYDAIYEASNSHDY
ncbi:MAG: BspA family leucine-rich repeat surface protein [Cellulosilyticaceae bacterium]